MVAWRMKFSGRDFPQDLILTAVRWYLRSNLSCRDVEELIAERGIVVDHSTINRWLVKDAP
jgi:transposase-like protein